jgi:hypothetical protein
MPEAKAELPASVFRTPLVRVSYPILDQRQLDRAIEAFKRRPKTEDDREPTPGATLIFDARSRADKNYKDRMVALANAIASIAKSRWPNEFAAVEMPWLDNGAFKSPWLDGNLPKYRNKDGLGEGTRFIRPSSQRLIPCVGRDGLPLADVTKIYPGCYAYALVAVYGYEIPRKNHGVSFGLRGLQFAEDGERLDDSIDVAQAFGALEGDENPTGEGLSELQSLFGAAAG